MEKEIDDIGIHQETFLEYFAKGDFVEILRCCLKNTSIHKLSSKLDCSRRSIGRYLSGERNIPFQIMKRLIRIYGIDEDLLIKKMEDEAETFCKKYQPETIEKKIIWYGKSNDIINSLYVLRKCVFKTSFFEMAYKIEINPECLSEYECGKKMITPTDIDKIISSLNISIIHLFPQLYSFDRGNTYLPLNLFQFTTGNKEFWDEYYTDPGDQYGAISIFQEYPINLYDSHGRVISNLMPNELPIDAYFHIDDIFLYNMEKEEYYEGPNFAIKDLPPNYFRHKTLFIDNNTEIKNDVMEKPIYVPAKEINIQETGQIEIIYVNGESSILDLRPYTESKSQWYQELNNIEYLKKGRLVGVDDQNRMGIYFPDKVNINLKKQEIDTQLILWPDGQYIRIDEITMDLNPYSKNFTLKNMISVDMIGNWMQWK